MGGPLYSDTDNTMISFECVDFWPNIVESFYSINYVNVNYSVKYSVTFSTVECKYLLFLQDFFFTLKPKEFKKCQYSGFFQKNKPNKHTNTFGN